MNRQIAFFDTGVEHHLALAESLPAGVERVVLDHRADGIGQIAQHLLGRSGIESIHIVSHGSPGALCLGRSVVDAGTLAGRGPLLARIGRSLAPGGDIVLYGCEVAAGDAGRSFIERLAALTGADVAASSVPIGATARGGTATLEVTVGEVSTSALFSQRVLDQTGSLLGTLPATLTPSASLGYWLGLNPNGDMAIADAISTTSEVDIWAFKPDTSGSTTLTVGGPNIDVMFRVYDQNGQPLTPNIDSTGTGANETTSLNVTTGNWYYIAAAGFSTSTGAYTTTINGPSSALVTVTLAAPGWTGSANGSIDWGGDNDYYSIVAPAGTTSLNLTVSASAGVNPVIDLRDSLGAYAPTVYANDSAGTTETRNNIPVVAGTTYHVIVYNYDRTTTGSYTLSADFSPDQSTGDPPATVTPLSGERLRLNPFGDVSTSSTITTGSEFKVYAFFVENPGSHVISVSGALDAEMRVYDANGAALTGVIDSFFGNGTETTTQNLANQGWIYVAVAGDQLQTGAYTLSINGPTALSPALNTPAPAFSGSLQGEVGIVVSSSGQGDVDYFTLVAPAGTTTLNLTATPAAGLDTFVQLYDGAGVRLRDIDNAATGGVDSNTGIAIVAGSTYFVGVSSFTRTGLGTYTIAADFNPDQGDVTAPTVIDPAPGAAALDSNLVVTFSEPVQPGGGAVLLRTASGVLVEQFTPSTVAGSRALISGNQLIIDPTALLLPVTGYTIDLQAAAVRDAAGNNLAAATRTFTSPAAQDTTAPTVIDPQLTVAALDANIVITFSELVQPGGGAVVLRTAAGAIVEQFTPSLVGGSRAVLSGNQLIIDPTALLLAGNGYSVELQAGAVRDAAGNLSAFVQRTFTAPAAADTTAPEVTSFSPGPNLQDNILVLFSEPVQGGGGTIVLRGAGGAVIEQFIVSATPGSRASTAGNLLTIDPSAPLTAGTGYTVEFQAAALRDLAGNNMVFATRSFTTSAPVDVTPPELTGFTPPAALADNLVVTFNEPVQAGSGAILLRSAAGAVIEQFSAGSARAAVNGSTLTIDPTALLTAGSGYSIELQAGAVRDLAGNNVAFATRSFSAAAPVDITPPELTGFTPPSALADNLVVTFNEPVQAGNGAILLRSAAGAVIEQFSAGSARAAVNGSTLTIDPTALLTAGSGYIIELQAGAVRDLAGNSGAFATRSFSAAAPVDIEAPRVDFLAPPSTLAGAIVITFTEPVLAGAGAVVLRSASGAVIEQFSVGSSRALVSGNALTLDPTADLSGGTGYTVELQAGALRDAAGNVLAFTTRAFSTGSVASTVPSPGDDNLTGTAGPDVINALAGNDVVDAGGGDDTIDGGPGADRINGGAGIDTSVYGGVRSDYLLSRDSRGTVTVADKFGVMDTLTEVEFLRIGSETIATSSLTFQVGVTLPPAGSTAGPTDNVFRFFNTRDRAYFYTRSSDERDMVIRESTDPSVSPGVPLWPYFYQGTTFEEAHSSGGGLPVYRFYNRVTGHHFFTISESEREFVLRQSTDPSFTPEVPLWPFNYEGIGFSAFPSSAFRDAIAVFRFYSPTLDRHFFTGNVQEAQEIRLTGVWNDEGIGYYGEAPG